MKDPEVTRRSQKNTVYLMAITVNLLDAEHIKFLAITP